MRIKAYPAAFYTAALLLLFSCAGRQTSAGDDLRDAFANPPQSARPMVWWHWMNGNISPDGLRKDILWMHRIGIGGFHIFDAGLDTPQITEKRLEFMSPEWKEALNGAVALADSLGMEVAVAASPGWSCTGGPWVSEEDAMKKLVWRNMQIDGGKHYHCPLPEPYTMSSRFQNVPLPYEHNHHQDGPIPEWYYKDIAVYAVRLPSSFASMEELGAKVSDNGGNGPFYWIQYEFPEPQSFRAVSIVNAKARSGGHAIPAKCKDSLQISDDGIHFRTLCGITVGAAQQQTECIPFAKARFWRLKRPNSGYAAINPEGYLPHKHIPINHYEEKAGFAYTCDLMNYPTPMEAEPCEVVDVTANYKDGILDWDAPEGRWMIYRFGCSLTGKKNHPASPEATGLEVDKLDKAAFARYLHHYLDMYKDAAGGRLGKTGIRYLMIDSYESGAQNWTSSLPEEFKCRRGYDMMPWLPAVAGVVIGDVEHTERFLWDFRRTIGELFAENYDNATEIVRQDYGMDGIFIESHEHGRNCPADGMSIKKTASYPMSAMWMEGTGSVNRAAEGKADIRESASVAHIYGQNLVAAESLTISGLGGKAFSYYPGNLKHAADLEMSAGVNRFVIHESAHQPSDDKVPGIGLGHYGQWFNRHETWAELAGPWIEYLSRSCALLQQGRYVADYLYYYGEDTNVTAQFSQVELKAPFGYGYDFIGAEALLKELKVKRGKLVTSTGMEYSTLFVGGTGLRMSDEVRERIDSFKKSGIRVLEGTEVHYVKKTIEPDLILSDTDNMQFVHRTAPDAEIYWICNSMDCPRTQEASFRTSGRKPRLWHPETGRISDLPYRFADGRTNISLKFAKNEAYFIVFEEQVKEPFLDVEEDALIESSPLCGPWEVSFNPEMGAPAHILIPELSSWTESSSPEIKYYSGTAKYRKTFSFNPEGVRYVLNLGKVGSIACVNLNGQDLGQCWKAPYEMDITGALCTGENTLEISVTNLWVNRLIGDACKEDRKTFYSYDFYKHDDTLLPSGLMGPVSIDTYDLHPRFSDFDNPDFAKMIFEKPVFASLNATPYDELGLPLADTPAPAGYKPVYISHYGRHGARSGSPGSRDLPSFINLEKVLADASAAGILTPEGKDLLAEVREVIAATDNMEGRLTERGKLEHSGIAERMYQRFAPVFKDGSRKVYALGSEYPRCLVSMASFTGQLSRMDPSLEIKLNSGPEYQKIIHNTATPEVRERRINAIDSLLKCVRPETRELMNRLFTDCDAASAFVPDPVEISRSIFRAGRIAGGFDIKENIFRHLPFKILYAWADFYNSTIYLGHGNSFEFGEDRMSQTRLLVNDIVNRADDALNTGNLAADLRFGHDFTLLALCARMGMKGVCERYDYEGARKHFICSTLIPFAANLQLVFYKKKGAPVLVKCLLNEKEMAIAGLKPVNGVYYNWEDLRATLVASDDFCLEAHRGISNRYPENTILAFKEAASAHRYVGMETDVQMTSDGVLVIMHDDTVERTTDGIGMVSDYTWKELSRLHIDGGYGWDEMFKGKLHIPLFVDYLRICREGGLVPYVELKLLTDEGIEKTIETLHAEGFSDDDYVLTSFNRHYVDYAGTLCSAKREFMKGGRFTHEDLVSLVGTGLVVRPDCRKIDQDLVDECHALGLELEAYGLPVGDASLLANLKAWGVKGVTCNDWLNLL